ncbi:hypothetical protein GCM10017566_12130 [Amycolatopsis bartoniae]|uniref:Uncharacterized protein n=1 Tax=Amycolatopsis bartoniae TaxID=941986 RepID=A0A8H9IPJ7_9PSEU|nr:hypothetical protein GCM10017566_12130 [Amycolatopsis bartoniae]
MSAGDQALLGERGEVPAGGGGGDPERVADLRDRHVAPFAHQLEQGVQSLLWRHRGRLTFLVRGRDRPILEAGQAKLV